MKNRFQFDDAFLVQAKPMKRIQKKYQGWTWIDISKVSFGIILFLFIAFFLLFQNTKPLAQSGYNFVFQTQNNNWAEAYKMLSPDLQKKYDQKIFETQLKTTILHNPSAQAHFHTIKPGHNNAILIGTIYRSDLQKPIQISITKTNAGWKVSHILIGTDPFGTAPKTPILQFGTP